MALVQTESANYYRDTRNRALINNNVEAYRAHKKMMAVKKERDMEILELKKRVEELSVYENQPNNRDQEIEDLKKELAELRAMIRKGG